MDRFWSKVDKSGDCWLWTAGRNSSGYGTFGFEGRVDGAHRVAYRLSVGPIPKGAHILHSCDNRPCVNPAHLRAGTPSDNMRDKVERGHHFNAQKTECMHGHPLDDINTYVTPNGSRNCRTCRLLANRASRARLRKAS